MKRMLSIVFTTLFIAGLAFSSQKGRAKDVNPGCIVQPEVIAECENSGGRFDFKSCSCVGGGETR